MKELIYIPSGKPVRFFDFSNNRMEETPSIGIEAFTLSDEGAFCYNRRTHSKKRAMTIIFQKILQYEFIDNIYTSAGIPLNSKLHKSEFIFVDV